MTSGDTGIARPMSSSLPNAIVVGAMKCATTAVHAYLDAHPEISMARQKEVNFFIGPDTAPHADAETWWRSGQWHRGLDWYASLFDGTAPVRGETSPGYTSPASVEVAARMAGVLPDARLVYLVRHPVDRAVSQYRHHVRDGTERRPMGRALLDPDSQYVGRSRYHERLEPFLRRFSAAQILVVVQERLLHDRGPQMGAVYGHLGADPTWRGEVLGQEFHVGGRAPGASPEVAAAFMEQVADDLARLRTFLQDELPEWAS